MASKANDTKNWRKGAQVEIGDVVEMVKVNERGGIDYSAGTQLQAVASKVKEGANYRLADASGTWTKCTSGHQFVKGSF